MLNSRARLYRFELIMTNEPILRPFTLKLALKPFLEKEEISLVHKSQNEIAVVGFFKSGFKLELMSATI